MAMATTQQTQITQINRAPIPAGDSKVSQLCILCCENPIIKRKFADCQHQGSCIKCAQKHMLAMIGNKKFPTCHLDPNCKAKMVTHEKSLFQYFKQKNKKQWTQFYDQECSQHSRSSGLKVIPCKMADCKGVILKNRCTKCSQFYCQKCGGLDHSIGKRCSIAQRQSWALQAKECPKCKQPYFKQEGCSHITCGNPKCKYQFCQVCQKSWNRSHHACSLLTSANTLNTNKIIHKKQSPACCAIF